MLSLDGVSLGEEFRARAPTLRDCPRFLRSEYRGAMMCALAALRSSYERDEDDNVSRSWTLFLLTPRMLLAQLPQQGSEGRELLRSRIGRWYAGDWEGLLADARGAQGRQFGRREAAEDQRAARMEQACAQVRLGNL